MTLNPLIATTDMAEEFGKFVAGCQRDGLITIQEMATIQDQVAHALADARATGAIDQEGRDVLWAAFHNGKGQ